MPLATRSRVRLCRRRMRRLMATLLSSSIQLARLVPLLVGSLVWLLFVLVGCMGVSWIRRRRFVLAAAMIRVMVVEGLMLCVSCL